MYKNIALIAVVTAFGLQGLPATAQNTETVVETVVTQELIEGEVVALEPMSRTITVRKDRNGTEKQYVVPRDTVIVIEGEPSSLSDLLVGDEVSIAVEPQTKQFLVTRKKKQNITPRQTASAVAANETAPVMLPKTASNYPLTLAFGFCLLVLAAIMRVARKRV